MAKKAVDAVVPAVMEAVVEAEGAERAMGDGMQLVTFRLGGEEYGLSIMAVQEIIRMLNVRITAIPNTEASVEGVINLRGKLVPVVDLGPRFGLPPEDRKRSSRVIVLNLDGRAVGIIVDAVVEVVKVAADSIEPLEGLAVPIDTTFVIGVGRVGGRMIIVIDVDSIFSKEEAASLDAAS
jgi:purine-binding chemotaxis protein CheW